MNVDLVTCTSGAEEIIARCARVSNPANADAPFERLIAYMIENSHWSPFEMANMVVKIETSRAISQQIVRHRSFSFQEFSQRYAQVQEIEIYEARRQDEKNRQNSIDDLPDSVKLKFHSLQLNAETYCSWLYREALELGIAKEQARFLLPMSSKTVLYMNGTLRSWIHYIQLRTGHGTQKEHMDIALRCQNIFKANFPTISRALEWT